MVDELIDKGISLLFCIGGDGTLKGAQAIAETANRRQAKISIIGIPKTIDNDLGFVEKTFGFETSVQIASEIITSAHHEAEGAENGIGIVKLMGRDSGFITATASLANSVVDFCLIPETRFRPGWSRRALRRCTNKTHTEQSCCHYSCRGGRARTVREQRKKRGCIRQYSQGRYWRVTQRRAHGILQTPKYRNQYQVPRPELPHTQHCSECIRCCVLLSAC